MKVNYYVVSDVGRYRENNEDNFYVFGQPCKPVGEKHMEYGSVQELDRGLFAVCDGMGGEEHGELAAYAAVKNLKLWESESQKSEAEHNIVDANEAILQIQREYSTPHSGSTIAALSFWGSSCLAYNIGDSRVYYRHGDEFKKISHDHSVVQQLVELGLITEDEADRHPDRSKLTKALGIESGGMKILPAFSEELTARSGDRFLICSDGLYEALSKEQLQTLMDSAEDTRSACKRLVCAALDAGSRDNVTAIIIEVI